MTKTVVIDCFPESARSYTGSHVIVAIDVIRATTTIVTAVAKGRRCFPVPSVEAAHLLAAQLQDPLWAGELSGETPPGFEMNNSPTDLDQRDDVSRPLIMLSSSGSRLIHEARTSEAVYVGCFRNARYLAQFLGDRHHRLAVIGAGSRGEFRLEDQICCAWIAGLLMDAGFEAENRQTIEIVERLGTKPASAIVGGNSAAYLRRSGQTKDLEFVLSHVDDVAAAFAIRRGEAVRLQPEGDPAGHQMVPDLQRPRLALA